MVSSTASFSLPCWESRRQADTSRCHSQDARERDRSLTIARSCDLDLNVTLRMQAVSSEAICEAADAFSFPSPPRLCSDAFEGKRPKKPLSQVLQEPRSRFAGVQQE